VLYSLARRAGTLEASLTIRPCTWPCAASASRGDDMSKVVSDTGLLSPSSARSLVLVVELCSIVRVPPHTQFTFSLAMKSQPRFAS